jgi:FtsH-binding integral membrane protein
MFTVFEAINHFFLEKIKNCTNFRLNYKTIEMSNQYNQQPPNAYPPLNDDKNVNPIGFKGYNTSTQPAPPSYDYGIEQNQFYPSTAAISPNNDGTPGSQLNFTFSDAKIRHAFIRKVYVILTAQLSITVGFIALFLFCEPVQTWFSASQNQWLLWVIVALTFVIIIVLACCDGVRRQHPLNLIILFVFTILESVLLGAISATYNTNSVILAAGITVFVVVGITIFSFQTKYDFTGMGIYLFVFLLVLFGFGILAAIIRSQILTIVYASIGAVIFSFYIVFDTQLMMGE